MLNLQFNDKIIKCVCMVLTTLILIINNFKYGNKNKCPCKKSKCDCKTKIEKKLLKQIILQLGSTKKDINKINGEINQLQTEIDLLQNKIGILQNEIVVLQEEQYFKENESGDIYTLKNVLIGTDVNIGTTNFYSKAISINRVSESIKQYYDSILNVNDIVNYILNNVETIYNVGFESVLKPYVENNYYENDDYFFITSCSNSENPDLIKNNKTLFSYKKYEKYTGTTTGELLKLNSEGKYIYYPTEGIEALKTINYMYYKLFEKYGLDQKNYFSYIKEFDNGISLVFKCILNIPNILPKIPGVNPDYIIVGSSVKLNKIIEDVDQIKLFSPEYVEFIKVVSNNMSVLQQIYKNLKNNIFDSTIQYDVWEYNTTAPTTSVCYYSSIYKDWIGKRASETVILGTNINIAQIITYIFNFNSKNLLLTSEEQVGVVEYSYNNSDNVFLTKIVTLNGKKYLIINNILINSYFNDAIRTNGDVTLEGAMSVNNWDGKNIFNLHTENQVLEVNGKIGINIQEPNALIDIASISTSEMNLITNQYSDLNKFIFGYFDYFINIFGTTNNRNWNQIYNNYLNKNQISVSTINLPFDFKTTNSSDPKFSEFINNFNNYVLFGYTEEEFKAKYEGKTAYEISNPYFNNYFYALKDYFLTIWNQKDYYLLNKYQTFTNVVNYFGGPVLRMQVVWYDEQYNVIRLFASNLKLDEYLLNENLNAILSNYYDSLFSCEQLTNLFSNLLKDPIIQQEQLNNPLYLTNWVANSYYKQRFGYPQNYIFCYKYSDLIEEEKYLFHELFNYWATNQSNKLQVPNQDILVSGALNQINNYIFNNFDTKVFERIMISFYFWQFEYKVSYVKIIEIENEKYVIGSGVNILDYIKKNILSNGDQQFNGSLRIIEPSSNQTVVVMDTTEKQVAIQYPLGLGTENPRSLLTIDDVSITNLFDYLDEFSKKNRYISDLAKQLNGKSTSNYQSIIESYTNPFTNLPYVQNVDNYFAVVDPNSNTNINDISNYQYNYHWYLKLWDNVLYKNVLNPSFDPVNKIVKPLAGNFFTLSPLNEVMFDKTLNLKIYNWVWGKKVSTSKYFVDSNNNIKYIHQGINFNQYFTRFNSNKNLQNIIYASQAIQIYLNELYLSTKSLSSLNQNELNNYLTQIKKEYTLYKLWVMDYPTDSNQTRLYLTQDGDLPINLNNLRPTDTIYNMLYNFDTSYHGNLTFEQILLFYQKIINIQQKINYYNGNASQLVEQDSNIVGYRTDEDYWLASWIYMGLNISNPISLGLTNVIVLYEFNVDDYLNQSIQMIGDLQMAGNLTLMNPKEYLKYVKNELPLSSLNPLVSIYPEEEFVGFGSQKIFTQYALNYKTIDLEENKVFAKNHVVISNPYYPNLVGERYADPEDIGQEEEYLQSNYSSFTVRRSTRIFTLEDIVTKGDGKFGLDISYEIQDKYDDTYEVAESGIKITGLKTFKNGIQYPIPKYFWNIVNDATDQNTVEEKTLMELDSESRLTVSKIKLGGYDLEAIDNGNGTQSLKWGSIILGTQPNP